MKTLGRILIILIAAAIVIGGTYTLSQTSAAQALVGQPIGQGQLAGRSEPLDFANGQSASASIAGFHQEGDRSGSWDTVIRNLIEMVMIVAAVQLAWSIGRWLKRKAASLTRKDRLNLSRT
ncbi:MAG TPA: hypothetical protein VMP08_23525 [Anaerolineae bacterium]|nr:hypothetical protein [Anaerolineae bacterium]